MKWIKIENIFLCFPKLIQRDKGFWQFCARVICIPALLAINSIVNAFVIISLINPKLYIDLLSYESNV